MINQLPDYAPKAIKKIFYNFLISVLVEFLVEGDNTIQSLGAAAL